MAAPSAQLDPRTPVLVGVGQVNLEAGAPVEAADPVALMAEAVHRAVTDAGAAALLAAVDSVRVVSILAVRHPDPGRLLADHMGISPADTALSPMGGNSPQSLVNTAALDIAAGRADAVIVTGCEPWRTRQAARRAGTPLPWASQDPATPPARVIGGELDMSHPAETALGIAMPVQVYPVFETALRAVAGRSPDAHLQHIAGLWSRFSQVAATNPYASVRHGFSAEEIATPTADNRWIGYPYTKWLVSNDRVDQGAALILCSAERAAALGISRDRWVFPLAGTDTTEALVSLRHDLHRSPAIRVGGRRCLELAGVDIDDVAHIDLYSCFPSAVQIGADELGLGLDRPLTVTGGLTFAGGPWNDYVTHSIATMVGVLRDDPGSIGLITANGGLISKHAFGLYSTEPPTGGFRHEAPQAEVDAVPAREAAVEHEGPVTVEAYTVMHGRDGAAERALAACLLPDGRRTWAASTDPDVMATFVADEGCGRAARVVDGTFTLA
ncbi:MAG: acetyl-CoA acetyltransferase [Acidimicrobiia bacterium]|nr:acetyl-CoA acetyltransferase [Acidimicrobiia bacterium]